MTTIWNVKDLSPPPSLSYEVKLSHLNAADLTSVCLDAISVLKGQEALHLEAATLSRLLYRMKSKLRCDKGFKLMTKVNRGLLRYLSMDLVSTFKTFKPSSSDNWHGTVCAPSRQMLEWLLVRLQGFARLFCQVMESCQGAGYFMKCRLHLGHLWDVGLISLAIVSRIWVISRHLVLCACEWYRKLKPYHDILKPVGIRWLPENYEFPLDLKEWLDAALLADPVMMKRSLGGRKQRIFDLIDLSNINNEAEVVELVSDEEIEMLVPEEKVSTVERIAKNSAEVVHHVKMSNTQMEYSQHSQGKVEDINSNLANDLSACRKKLVFEEDLGEAVSSSFLTFLSPSTPLSRHQEVVKPKKKEKVVKNAKLPTDQQVKTNKKARDLTEFLKTEDKSQERDKLISLLPSARLSPHQKVLKPKKKEKLVEITKLPIDQQIKMIKTGRDLSKFLKTEDRLRKRDISESLSGGLDKLQWHMLCKVLNDLVCKLKSESVVKGSDEYKKIMKRVRKEIRTRIQ